MHKLLSVFGIELEYMIVDKDSLEVLPISDKILRTSTGEITQSLEHGAISWSNELVLHVLELKTNGPAKKLDYLDESFHKNVQTINNMLEKHNGLLLPSAMHPFMHPETDMRLWTHGDRETYEMYNKVFNCKGHGWANLQSTHLNLPFSNDVEFGRLYAAIRVILPILPALAASSPFKEGKATGWLDTRVLTYKDNQKKVPQITADIIPEPFFTIKEYEDNVLTPMYEAISPYDPDELLQAEWLNSRGAIARFIRNAIEIRVLDIQECPKADLAVVSLIVETLKSLTNESACSYETQQKVNQTTLVNLLNECTKNGRKVKLQGLGYSSIFGVGEKETVEELLISLAEAMPKNAPYREEAIKICSIGSLSERILKMTGATPSKADLISVYRLLANCLNNNQLFEV